MIKIKINNEYNHENKKWINSRYNNNKIFKLRMNNKHSNKKLL